MPSGTIGPQPDSFPSVEAALADLRTNPGSVLRASANNYPAQCIDGRPAVGENLPPAYRGRDAHHVGGGRTSDRCHGSSNQQDIRGRL